MKNQDQMLWPLRGRLGAALAAAVLGMLLAVGSHLAIAQAPPSYYDMPEYRGTNSRIDLDAREAILGPAQDRFWRGEDIAGGLCAYEALIAQRSREHGVDSLQVADTRVYFGADIASAGYFARSLPFMEAGLADYRKVFGPDHPETAIVLMDLATTRTEAFGDAALGAAIDEAAQAHAILLKAKGANDPETALALSLLARLTGRPGHTKGQPDRIDASNALFEEAARTYPMGPYKPVDIGGIYEDWAKMLVANGQTSRALEVLEPTRKLHDGPGVIFYLIRDFRDGGQVDAARAIAKRYGQRDVDMTPQASDREPLPTWPDGLHGCPAERGAEFGL